MKEFDLAISFAGEDRKIAKSIASILKKKGLLVFYDDDEQANLLGECLTEYLTDIYKNKSSYCIVLVSRHYINKRWTRLEWKAAQARAFEDFNSAYILPIKLDNSELPGLLSTIGYLSLNKKNIKSISETIYDKTIGLAHVNRSIRKANDAFKSGNFESVIKILRADDIFQSINKDRPAIRLICDSYMAMGEFEEAIKFFDVILNNIPEDADSYFLAGICLRRLKRDKESIPYFENTLKFAPQNVIAREELKAARQRSRFNFAFKINRLK